MSRRFIFSDDHKEQIREAVASLEKESSGEIVPYFVYQSDDYEEANWLYAIMFGVISLLIISALSYTWSLPPGVDPIVITIIVLGMMVIGYLIALFSAPLRVLAVSKNTQQMRVEQRAMEAFLKEEIFQTVDRTGVLIFVSQLEHEVVVLGDSGINEKVDPEEWEKVVQLIIDRIKKKKVAEGIVRGINECKDLLLKNGFTVRPDDKNELSDDLRIE